MSANPTSTLMALCLLLGSGADAAKAIAPGSSTGIAGSHGRTHSLSSEPLAALDLWTFDLADLVTADVVEAAAPAQADPAVTPLEAMPHQSGSVGSGSVGHADARPAGPDSGRAVYRSLIHGDQEHRATVRRWGYGPQTRFTGFLAPHHPPSRGPGRRVPEKTLRGVLVAQTLTSPEWADLQLSGGWLSGTVHDGVVASEAAPRSGNTWSLAARAALPTEGLSLSFEYAGTRVQPEDRIEEQGRHASIVGQAYAAGAEMRSVGDTAAAWRIGTEYRWVGPDFESVANPALPRDRARLRSFARLGGEDWQIDLRLDREHDNLSRSSAAPTSRRDGAELATSWRPPLPKVSEHLGQPRVKLVAGIDRNDTHEVTGPHAGSLHLKRRLRLESEFQGEGWRWGIAAAKEALDRNHDDGATSVADTTSLRLYGDPSSTGALPLRPSLSWRRHEDAGPTDRSWRAELRTRPVGLGRGLHANLDLGYLRRWREDSGDLGQRLDLSGSLSWTLQRPSAGRKGLALTVSGKAVSGEAAAAVDVDYGLRLSLSTSNPLAGW